jgi:hypothetical protein
MQQQRAHEDRISLARLDQFFRALLHKMVNLLPSESAAAMASRDYPQSAIAPVAGIQMEPDSDHLFQDFDRRLHVVVTSLTDHGP